jgi:hypothetical protein
MKITWVTMGPDPYFATCNRCGKHVDKPPLPMSISAFCKYNAYALELHRNCKE